MRAVLTTLLTLFFAATSCAQAQPANVSGLRETVGCVETKGWERNIVENNPNLHHWTWLPIYTNIQAVHNSSQPATTGPGAQSQPLPTAPPQRHYLKPVELPLPIPEWRKNLPSYPTSRNNVSGSLHHEQVSGELSHRRVGASLLSKPPMAASYSNYMQSASGSSSLNQRAEVHGRLAASGPGHLLHSQ